MHRNDTPVVHLRPPLALNRPATLAVRASSPIRPPGDRLFILGDLFDAWIGDDDATTNWRTARAGRPRANDRRAASDNHQRGNRGLPDGAAADAGLRRTRLSTTAT